nr:hypothetical protein [uncultured Cupriavidus sp.]
MISDSAALRASHTIVAAALLITGCANVNVSQVKDGDATKGLRYYLPKPYLQTVPQADGTINVEVIFLPDRSRSYAIDTSSYLSSYTFQASRDEKGLLTAIEFKASTAAVGQQLASSFGTYAVQAYNMQTAAAVAQQAQINTAQTALDTARSNLASAEATLASNLANGASADTVRSDRATVASARAKADIAAETLLRTQTTSQLVNNASAAAGSTVTTTGPTLGTGFPQPGAWTQPAVVNLPQQFGPVLYAVNDNGSKVSLVAVKAKLDGTTTAATQGGVQKAAQPAFRTTSAALGPPSLVPISQTQPTSVKQATFVFDRPVKEITSLGSSTTTDTAPPVLVDASAAPKLSGDGKTVTVDTTKLKAGNYLVTVAYKYVVDPAGNTLSNTKQAKLTITP